MSAGLDVPRFDGGQALSHKRLSTDVAAAMRDLGYEPRTTLAAGRPPSDSLGQSPNITTPAFHGRSALRLTIQLDNLMISDHDILTFHRVSSSASEAAVSTIDGPPVLSILLAKTDYFLTVPAAHQSNILETTAHGTGGGNEVRHPEGLGLANGSIGTVPVLLGEHAAKLEVLRRLGRRAAVVLPIEHWRKAGGGKAGLKARRLILEECMALSGRGRDSSTDLSIH